MERNRTYDYSIITLFTKPLDQGLFKGQISWFEPALL